MIEHNAAERSGCLERLAEVLNERIDAAFGPGDLADPVARAELAGHLAGLFVQVGWCAGERDEDEMVRRSYGGPWELTELRGHDGHRWGDSPVFMLRTDNASREVSS